MHNTIRINEDVTYVGGSERRLAKFENQYPLANGVSYNSYVVNDEKTVLLDTCDRSIEPVFLANVEYALGGRDLDHLIIDHMEPDHASTLGIILQKYPNATVYGTMQVPKMILQFTGLDVSARFVKVKDGDSLNTGKHTFNFITAPMVHWPEVMMTYDSYDRTLYSADAFGRFGALSGNIFSDETDVWFTDLAESRRYYTNIVGKFGTQVQNVLKKAAALDIQMICPLHGPILRKDLGYYIDKYDKWSSYTPEDDSVVIAYASVYGGTENACEILASRLAQKGVKNIRMYDVSKTHFSYIVSEAFRAKTLVFASMTLDTGLFPSMELLLSELKAKNLSNRNVALIENGTWGPQSNKLMSAMLEGMNNINILDAKVSIKSAPAEADLAKIDALADAIMETL